MKRANILWVQIITLITLVITISLSVSGCQEAHAEDLHEESSACSVDDGHDHGAEEQEVIEVEEVSACSVDDGHDHEAEENEEEEAQLVLSQRNIEAAGIQIAVAASGNIEESVQLLGEVSMNNNQLFHIVPPVVGIVQDIRVQIGDQVQAGDVLAVLSSRDLAEARTEYLRARSSHSLAQTVHSNQQELYENEFLSEQDFQVSTQQYTEADIELQAARQTLVNLGLSTYEIGRISSGSSLTRQELKAPIDGTVVHLNLAPGEIVGDENTVLTVADLSTVWIDFDVLQTDIGAVRAGQAITVSPSGTHIISAETVLDFVSPVMNRATRTLEARAELPNPYGHWIPGQFVTAAVTTSMSDVSVIVNKDAVQLMDGETVVFVPHGEAFESLPVVLGISNRTFVEIQSGLSQGAQYVSEGAFSLKAEMVTSGLDSHAGHGH